MAINLWIPRIEFNDLFIFGDISSGSPTISNLTIDTNFIATGMYITGTGIPALARVLSKTPTTITLDMNATVTSIQQSLDLFKRFDFTFPPAKDSTASYKPKHTIIDSLSGVRQIQTNYLEGERDLEHWFMSETDKDILEQEFYLSWAVFGCEFRYYPDKADGDFVTCSLTAMDFSKTRQVKKHPYFLYKIPMKIRWVQSIPIAIRDHILTESGDVVTDESGNQLVL